MIHYKPKILSWPQIWEMAEEFRRYHKYAATFPVEIEDLIEFELGIDIIPTFGLKQTVGVEAFLSKNRAEIRVDSVAYNNPVYLSRLRFTLAEEVAHLVLHKEIYEDGVSYSSEEEFIDDILSMDEDDLNWIERQARQFAGRLLVPLDHLDSRISLHNDHINQLHARYRGAEEVEKLAIEGFSKKVCGDFAVSWEVIRNRINYEKLDGRFKR